MKLFFLINQLIFLCLFNFISTQSSNENLVGNCRCTKHEDCINDNTLITKYTSHLSLNRTRNETENSKNVLVIEKHIIDRIIQKYVCYDGVLCCTKISKPTTKPTQTTIKSTQTTIKSTQTTKPEETPAKDDNPWMVKIIKMVKNQPIVTCGGILITPQLVLTSGYCFRTPYNEQLDKLRIIHIGYNKEFEERLISRIIIHPEINLTTRAYNVALIFLNEPFNMTDYELLLETPEYPVDQTKCIFTGWGRQTPEIKTYPTELKIATMSMLNNDNCIDKFIKNMGSSPNNFDESIFCASGNEDDYNVCTKDDGSPLLCLDQENNYNLVGIVNWYNHTLCGKNRTPTIFTRVADIKDWIETNM